MLTAAAASTATAATTTAAATATAAGTAQRTARPATTEDHVVQMFYKRKKIYKHIYKTLFIFLIFAFYLFGLDR